MEKADLPADIDWLEIVHPEVDLGHTRYALFDFDGTVSVIRHGWEQIMRAVMLESICPGRTPPPEIEAEVVDYIDRSTGILTIKQMKWLEETVGRYGMAKDGYSASQYKRMYNERLLQPVYQRLAQLDGSQSAREAWMIAGATGFLRELTTRGVKLFLASGTDQAYVDAEAAALGVTNFFAGHVYGAQGDSETDSKEQVINRILHEHDLHGKELLVVGDGPVEIQYARQAGAVSLGVAADESLRRGLNPRKRQRLLHAGADIIVTDFTHYHELAAILTPSV